MLPKDYSSNFIDLLNMIGCREEFDNYCDAIEEKINKVTERKMKYESPNKTKELTKKIEKFVDEMRRNKVLFEEMSLDNFKESATYFNSKKDKESAFILGYLFGSWNNGKFTSEDYENMFYKIHENDRESEKEKGKKMMREAHDYYEKLPESFKKEKEGMVICIDLKNRVHHVGKEARDAARLSDKSGSSSEDRYCMRIGKETSLEKM